MVGIQHEKLEKILWLTPEHRVLAKPRPRSLGGEADWSAIPTENFRRGRVMRRTMTLPERKLWQALRRKGIGMKFRRQHPIGPYIADFYSREASLVIEVDGVMAHFGTDAAAYDAARDAHLRSLGLRVVRFPATDILHRLDVVVKTLASLCASCVTNQGAEWVDAAHVCVGDTVLSGARSEPARVARVIREQGKEEVFGLAVKDARSFLTEVCVVHDCAGRDLRCLVVP